MSYCRCSDTCDLYLLHIGRVGYQFWLSNNDEVRERMKKYNVQDRAVNTAKEALTFAKELKGYGFKIPDHAIQRLEAEVFGEENILSVEEVKALPLELKVCLYLLRWNKQAKIQTVQDWVDTFWVYYVRNGESSSDPKEERIARRHMLEEYDRLYQFISTYIIY